MLKVDATVMLFSDSEQQRSGHYHRGDKLQIIALLAVAGIDDPAFGEMIIHAGLHIADELEKREAERIAEA